MQPSPVDHRRSFIRRSLSLASAPSLAGAVAIVFSQQAQAQARPGAPATKLVDSPYGPVGPKPDMATGLPLLQLPQGFEYKSFAWAGDAMSNGQSCKGAVDGMAVIRARGPGRSAELTLVRNHELGGSSLAGNMLLSDSKGRYDNGVIGSRYSAGGTSTLVFRDGNWLQARASLGGTRSNCAGGLTPWGTWLSCEEVGSEEASSDAGKRHGYVFEVPADGVSSGEPLIGLGRFRHEAAAVDPATGIVYLSEDDTGKSGLYRFVPSDTTPASGSTARGRLGSLGQGGRLFMAKVKGFDNAVLVDAPQVQVGRGFTLEWVPIAQPDQARGVAQPLNPVAASLGNCSGCFVQGWAQGAARFNRGEGLWIHEGALYFIDTTGHNGTGALWQLDLKDQTLTCLYASPNASVGNMVDNLTISPRAGVLMCEDGGGSVAAAGQRLMGLTPAGGTYEFARNNVNLTAEQCAAAGKFVGNAGDHRGAELAGACFDPSGQWLFVNLYTPGITVAITGPWGRGNL
jgi:hypothetical protein